MASPEMSASDSSSRKHVVELDGVRGLAVLAVMLHHFSRIAQPATGPARLLHVFDQGWVGVDLFFVLSGFLITGILLDAKAHQESLMIFYVRRALRILPLYYFVLLFAWLVPKLLSVPDPAEQHTFWLWCYLANIPKTFSNLGQPSHVLFDFSHLWSLAIEEQFYLVWPWVVLLLPKRSFLVVAGGCLLLTLAVKALLMRFGVPAMKADYFTFVRMDGLCAGALVASLVRRFPASDVLRVAKPVGAGALALLVACVVLKQRLPGVVTLTNHFQLSLAFAALVAISFTGAGGTGPLRFLRTRAMVWLGQRSYGLYVWHFLLHRQMVRLLDHVPGLGHGGTWDLLRVAALLALSCGAAVLSWTLIERPFLRLKERLGPAPTSIRPSAQA